MFCFSLEQIEFNTNSNTGAHGGVEKDDENKVSLWEYSSGYSHPSVGSPGASWAWDSLTLSESMAFIWILS